MSDEELKAIMDHIMQDAYVCNWMLDHFRELETYKADKEDLRELLTRVFIVGYNQSSKDTDKKIYDELISIYPHLKEKYWEEVKKENAEKAKNMER